MTSDGDSCPRARRGGVSRRQVLLGTAGAAALGPVTLGMSGRARAAAAVDKTTLTFGLENYPPNLNPFQHTGSASGSVKLLINRGLLSYNTDGSIAPELAESWTVEEGRVYTFKLRAGAIFHNGEKVTSDDVKYSFGLIKADPAAKMTAQIALIDTIETPDPLTVKITLKQPSVPYPNALANINTPIISAKAHQADPKNFVGAGPFTLVSQERGVSMQLAANPKFYKPGKPKLAHIKIVPYTDDSARTAALEAGDANIVEDVPWPNMDELAKNPRLKLETVQGAFMFLSFNVKSGPFADARVRRAVGMAIKRVDILNSAFSGKGAPLEGLPIPDTSPLFDAATSHLWPYDPDQAKQLLNEAGYPNGFSTTLLATSSPKIHTDTAIVVQQALATVGIQVKLNLPDWSTRVGLGNRGQYEFAINGTALDFNDPDALTYLLQTGPAGYQRSYGFSSPKIDAMLADARGELDPAKRKQLYAVLSKQVGEESPLIGLTWRAQSYGMDKNVHGFVNLPGFLTFNSPCTLEDTTIS